MWLMSVTAEASKDDRSREVSDEQSRNMPPISVTLEASKEDRSSTFKELHLSNIPLVSKA